MLTFPINSTWNTSCFVQDLNRYISNVNYYTIAPSAIYILGRIDRFKPFLMALT